MDQGGVSFIDARAPDGMRIYAIGDVHGCDDLLVRLLEAIDTEIASDRPADWRIVTLGDYVDRGPDSRAVLELLSARKADERFIALAGNHDEGMLDFLGSAGQSQLFLEYGGAETAASYGVALDPSSTDTLERSCSALMAALPDHHLSFLTGLDGSATFGDFFFAHAGIRPGVPLGEQSRRDLTWIRGEFLRHSGLHPKYVVHGHTPVRHPEILPNRADIDTGAFATGVLTAMVFERNSKRLMQMSRDGGVHHMAAALG